MVTYPIQEAQQESQAPVENSTPPSGPALPPGCEMQNGSIVRVIEHTAPDGSTREEIRPVTLNWDEARAKRIDFHHSEFGWIRYGYKLERDRSGESIMADTSVPLTTERPEPILPV